MRQKSIKSKTKLKQNCHFVVSLQPSSYETQVSLKLFCESLSLVSSICHRDYEFGVFS